MENQVPQAARELLTLERKWQSGGLDDAENERWSRLAVAVFGDANARHGRRSFRLPADVNASVRVGRGTFECELLEVSRLGMTFRGELFKHLIHAQTLDLIGVTMKGTSSTFDLKCQIERLDTTRKPSPVVGVSILPGNDAATLAKFVDGLYYPIYLLYLEEVAQGMRVPTLPPPA